MKTLLATVAVILATTTGSFAFTASDDIAQVTAEFQSIQNVREARPNGSPVWSRSDWIEYKDLRDTHKEDFDVKASFANQKAAQARISELKELANLPTYAEAYATFVLAKAHAIECMMDDDAYTAHIEQAIEAWHEAEAVLVLVLNNM